MFLIRFESMHDKMRVLDGTPWSIHKRLIVIKEWEQNKSTKEINFSTENVWVQVLCLPMNQVTLINAQNIADSIFECLVNSKELMVNDKD